MANIGRLIAPKERINHPPLREDPYAPDGYDGQRAEWVKRIWHEQDDLLRRRDRQIEENVRMLLGQQWIVWDQLRGRYIDVSKYLDKTERRWRQFPVMNRLLMWYMTMHARMTENPARITFSPGPDRIDAVLAEAMDAVFKHASERAQMIEVMDNLFRWLIPSGQAFLKSRIDFTRGDFIGPQLAGQGGEGMPSGVGEMLHGGDPFLSTREGEIQVDVLTAYEARGEWGPMAWYKKNWHMHRTFLTPEQAFDTYGVEMEPDLHGSTEEDVNSVWRVLFGSGMYGIADDGPRHAGVNLTPMTQTYVTIYELWQSPNRREGQGEDPGNPGGRLITVSGAGEVLRDGPRYAPFAYCSPIRSVDYLGLPGRPSGTSPQEMLNGPVRTRNRLTAQALAHATLVSNPTQMIDTGTGLKKGDVKQMPGQQIYGNFSHTTGDPIRYAAPPPLGSDVYNTLDLMTREIDLLGSISGTEGEAPTSDASGELVKELRYNADRVVGPTMRGVVRTLARMAEDWMVMIPLIWDQEKVLQVTGEDNIARTITVSPEMFESGNVNIVPEIESMLPESRGERQKRVWAMYREGLFGDPMDPQAQHKFLELARFPDLGRAFRPGGVDRTTAEQNVGHLLQGAQALQIPVYEWYDMGVHLFVLEQYMKSPEFKKADPMVQEQMVMYRAVIKQAEMAQMAIAQQQQLAVMQRGAAAEMGAANDLMQYAADAGLKIPGPPEEGATGDAAPQNSPETSRGAA